MIRFYFIFIFLVISFFIISLISIFIKSVESVIVSFKLELFYSIFLEFIEPVVESSIKIKVDFKIFKSVSFIDQPSAPTTIF